MIQIAKRQTGARNGRICHDFFGCAEGAVAVEFVIVLPVLLALVLLIAASSLHFAVSTEVQQLAFELARASLPIAGSDGWCDTLNAVATANFIPRFSLLEATRLEGVTCAFDSASGFASVVVNYDMSNTMASVLGRAVFLDLDAFSRSAWVQL